MVKCVVSQNVDGLHLKSGCLGDYTTDSGILRLTVIFTNIVVRRENYIGCVINRLLLLQESFS